MLTSSGEQEPVGILTDQSTSNGGLRPILLLSFGGLLALLLFSGASALRTLRRLHDIEQSARARSVERERVLATVVLSANLYNNRMEEFLLSVAPPERSDDEISKRGEAARSSLRTYPLDGDSQEAFLLNELERYLAEQDSLLQSVRDWRPEQRQRRAAQVLSEEVIPRRAQFVAAVQEIEVLNEGQSDTARRAIFLEFGRLQDRLAGSLIVVLGCGLILAMGSAFYILRLERQAEFRYRELADHRRHLQELSNRLIDAQEAERRSISRELHDEVGQALGLLLIDLGQLSNQASGEEKTRELVQRAKAVAERTVQTVRNMALLLRPSMLDDLGLVSAVEWYARELSRRGEMEVEVRSKDVSEQLPDEVKVCVYRVVQEALTNAQRHAHATSAAVELMQADGLVRVKVTDTGRGFDPNHTRGVGLHGMEERVKRLGGKFVIESDPSTGTAISVDLPVTKTG